MTTRKKATLKKHATNGHTGGDGRQQPLLRAGLASPPERRPAAAITPLRRPIRHCSCSCSSCCCCCFCWFYFSCCCCPDRPERRRARRYGSRQATNQADRQASKGKHAGKGKQANTQAGKNKQAGRQAGKHTGQQPGRQASTGQTLGGSCEMPRVYVTTSSVRCMQYSRRDETTTHLILTHETAFRSRLVRRILHSQKLPSTPNTTTTTTTPVPLPHPSPSVPAL